MALFQTENLWLQQLAEGVAALYLDAAGRPVNVLSRSVLRDLAAALDYLETNSSLQLLIVRSAKKANFIAGADLKEFAGIQTQEEALAISAQGQRLFDRLEKLRMPTVAIIAGACLGGGLELALACDYRVVVADPKTQLGLPEIELGLIPGWGGTQRLPRVIGLQKAFHVILGRKRLRAADAHAWGLADALVASEDHEPPAFLNNPVKRPKLRLPLARWRDRLLEGTALGRWLIYRGTERVLRRRIPDDMPAPWEALAAVRTGIERGMEAGLKYESEAVSRLAVTNACRNLIYLFLQGEQARKVPERQPHEEPPIRRVGVVGTGVMGAGIAQLAALRGCDVVLQEIDESALGMGLFRILGLFKQAQDRGLLAPGEMEKRLAAIHGSTTWKGYADLDLAVEAIIEDLDKKRDIFQEMEKHVAPSTILASNTSSLCVHDLQKGLKHPGRVAGLHFFNPVHKMPLVEVVRTAATRPEVITSLQRFCLALGKVPVVVRDRPGFLVNRVLMPYLNEAVTLVGEGLRVELIDKAMRRFGMPVGPLELLDQIGLDVAAHVVQAMEPIFGERLTPQPAFAEMVRRGWRGQKSGVGFYRWRGERKSEHAAAERLIRELAAVQGIRQIEPASPEDLMHQVRERLVLLMVNESAACLDEEIVESADTLNLALVLGTGWASQRGGPLRYAEQRGYAEVVAALQRLAEQHGPRFEPQPRLQQLALV